MHPPPPSRALERALADLRPIRTRRPGRVLAAVAGASLAYAALLVWRLGLRAGLATLPILPFVLYGACCLGTFLALLWCALVPPDGQVLPAGEASLRMTTLMLAGLVGVDFAIALLPFAPGAPGIGVERHALTSAWRCLATTVGAAVAPVALSLWSLRRLLPVDGWRVMTAIGGAGGALAGLVLHLHCAVPGRAHVGLVHGAGLVLPALILTLATVGRLSSGLRRDMSCEEPRNGF